jgi:ParB-like chromosome segregation protein Spo0J
MTNEAWDHGSAQASAWLAPAEQRVDQVSVTTVPLGALSVAGSPRMSGENTEHARALAETQEQLPPIIVHRATMNVIDGVHRLRAAKLKGHNQISVRFFSGSEEDAFVVAVRSNIKHGLPLSLAEREAAAKRIITSHPQWSDRMIASVAGLASKTVAEIRRRHVGPSDDTVARIGRDGRVRPIDGTAGRVLAAELISGNPDLTLRQVAQVAGISHETARDVRHRLQRGEGPLPGQGRKKKSTEDDRHETRRTKPASAAGSSRKSDEDRAVVIRRLRADPTLRFTETGRALLRLLHVSLMPSRHWDKIAANVPSHCSIIIAHLARDCAQLWAEFADQVEQKVADKL